MATDTGRLLDAALEYAALGWRVVPLHWIVRPGVCSCHRGPTCATPGKHPYGKDWQKNATIDEDRLIAFWERHPQANVGIKLGAESCLIDFETDDEEQEKVLLALFDGNVPVCPTWKSSRGKHRGFEYRLDLPGGAVHSIGKLCVRIGNGDKGAMSVMPPSLHPSGCYYEWLVRPDECPPPPLPEEVVARLWNWDGAPLSVEKEKRPPEHWERLLTGVSQGSRDESLVSYAGKLLRAMADLGDPTLVDVLYQSLLAWNARNRPPLPETEVKKSFLSILRAEENRRTAEAVGPALRDPPEVTVNSNGKPDLKGMRLVIVRSDPPMYELHASQFGKAEGGRLLLTAEQLVSARSIKIAALKQADYPLPKNFGALWEGTVKQPGLYERLVFHAESRDAPAETKRHLVVAERLLSELTQARVLDEGRDPDSLGWPCKLPDGSVVFGFTTIWEEMSRGPDKITRNELSSVLEKIGAVWFQSRRFKRLRPDAIGRLQALVAGNDVNDQPHIETNHA